MHRASVRAAEQRAAEEERGGRAEGESGPPCEEGVCDGGGDS